MKIASWPQVMCCVVTWCAAVSGAVFEVAGELKKTDDAFKAGDSYRLTADATFDWRVSTVNGDVDLNGHTLTMETGGGNRTVFSGAIVGKGGFIWNGGGNAQWQTVPSFLTGKSANTFTGPLVVLRGTLALAKPAGVDAVACDVVLGGGTNQAILRLDAPNQIKDTANLTITGEHEGRIWTQGFGETLGTLDLQSHGYIDLGDGASVLAFADSSAKKWNLAKTLTIQNWTEGKDSITFGHGEAALTASQLSRIGFADPSGRGAGLYAAKITATGELVPDEKVHAVHPPFDMTDQARAERKAFYETPGRRNLAGEASPLRDGMTIDFFGDSITWQNVFIRLIDEAIKAGPGGKGKTIRLINHGINGGGVLSIRDGSDKAAYVDAAHTDGPQAPFAKVIAADKANVAVIYIGINDVWWRNTTPTDFDKALRDIVAAARENKTIPVLATLSVYQEKPDGSNPKDAGCDQFAEITRKVAKETGVTLIDLRRAFMDYLKNNNADLRVDGSVYMVPTGVLTYDGVHPTERGNALLADQISQGIYEALRDQAKP